MNFSPRRTCDCWFLRRIGFFLLFPLTTFAGAPPASFAQPAVYLPAVTQRLDPTPPFHPPLLKGIRVWPDKPLQFDFIVTPGQAGKDERQLDIRKMVNYFFAALTIPKTDLWVNLSPYEKDRIIAPDLAATEMGRDLLAQDYLLKQLLASLMDPNTPGGKEFWRRVYREARSVLGTTNVPVSTFDKIWIIPQEAEVIENWPRAYVSGSHLKVLLDQDYLSLARHGGGGKGTTAVSRLAAAVIKDLLLPKIEQEINNGRYFAPLRQAYHALILAEWYKRTLPQGPLARLYIDRGKVKGIDLKDRTIKDRIYKRYLVAYRKGMYNLIKEDYDAGSRTVIARKYFSGGITLGNVPLKIDKAMSASPVERQFAPGTSEVRVEADAVNPIAPGWLLHLNTPPDQVLIKLDLASNTSGDGEAIPDKDGFMVRFLKTDGGAIGSMLVSNAASVKAENIYAVEPLPPAALDDPARIRANHTNLPGVGFIYNILFKAPEGSGKEAPVKIGDILMGSEKSIRDWGRRGPGDLKAAADIESFVAGGKDIMVDGWKVLRLPGQNGVVLETIKQPRQTRGPHDEHNYVLRLKFPEGVKITLVDNGRGFKMAAPGKSAVNVNMELYSDHTPLQRYTLEELFQPEVLERWAQLQKEERAWFPAGGENGEDRGEFRAAVVELKDLLMETNGRRRRAASRIKNLRNRIDIIGRRHLRLSDDQLRKAKDPLRFSGELPFFESIRFGRLLYSTQYLISRGVPMRAGSIPYPGVFPPDAFITLRELLGFLRPEVVRDQFYSLLETERGGQFPHEIDNRLSRNNPEYQDERGRLIRADTELLAMLFAETMLEHKEYGIDWNHVVRRGSHGGPETVAQIIGRVAGYVLGKAETLKDPKDREHYLTPKEENDTRGSWRDGAPSTFYGKYIFLLQYLMVPALEAIEKLDGSLRDQNIHVLKQQPNFKDLTDKWRAVRGEFEFTQTREERIQALMNWYKWKINKENQAEGFDFILALFEDAKAYLGVRDYTFHTESKEALLASIRSFLTEYLPPGPFVGIAIAKDAEGRLIKIDDTDPFMFAVSSFPDVPMHDIKKGLKSEFTHVVFGGTATTSGELLTGLPTVLRPDFYVQSPVGIEKPVSLYDAHRGNYHTFVKWISMEYKKLNGLLRQVNHRLDNGEGFSPDVKKLVLAIMLRFDELSRLDEMSLAETLEPYKKFSLSSKTFKLGWRPYGSSDALTKKKKKHGIHSGAMQGFNLMILAADLNYEKLLTRLASAGHRKVIERFVGSIRNDPAKVRQNVNAWLDEPAAALPEHMAERMAADDAMPAPLPQKEPPGGIDLNTDLFKIKIRSLAGPSRAAPGTATLPAAIEGLSPRIIGERPFRRAEPNPFSSAGH